MKYTTSTHMNAMRTVAGNAGGNAAGNAAGKAVGDPARTAAWIAAAVVAAAFLAACGDDHNNSASVSSGPVAPEPATLAFSSYAENIFASPANSTPAVVNGVNIVYDVNNDPTAFTALFM